MITSNSRVQHYEKMLHNRNIYDTKGLPAHIAKGLAKQMDSGFKKYGESGIDLNREQQSRAEKFHKITLGQSLQNPIEMEISRNQGAVTGKNNPPGYNDYVK